MNSYQMNLTKANCRVSKFVNIPDFVIPAKAGIQRKKTGFRIKCGMTEIWNRILIKIGFSLTKI